MIIDPTDNYLSDFFNFNRYNPKLPQRLSWFVKYYAWLSRRFFDNFYISRLKEYQEGAKLKWNSTKVRSVVEVSKNSPLSLKNILFMYCEHILGLNNLR